MWKGQEQAEMAPFSSEYFSVASFQKENGEHLTRLKSEGLLCCRPQQVAAMCADARTLH